MTNSMILEYCPKGQKLRKKWTDRVRANPDVFFSKTLLGFKNHVKKCPRCLMVYRARHGIPNAIIVSAYIKRATPQTVIHRGDDSHIVIGGKVPRAKPCQ